MNEIAGQLNIIKRTLNRLSTPFSFTILSNNRVNQIDASLLDDEMFKLLRGQLSRAFQYAPRLIRIRDTYDAELSVLLKAILFKLTVWDNGTTYGGKLQNLKLSGSKSVREGSRRLGKLQARLLALGIVTVLGEYTWIKLHQYLQTKYEDLDMSRGYDDNNNENSLESRLARLRRWILWSESANRLYSLFSLLNYLVFLFNGQFSTILLRALKIRLTPVTRVTNGALGRNVSYEFQNRQLVWNTFTEFLLFILPLMNVTQVKRSLNRLVKSTGSKSGATKSKGELSFLPRSICAICYKNNSSRANTNNKANGTGAIGSSSSANNEITNPYQSVQCGCVYSYVCIMNEFIENDVPISADGSNTSNIGWTCLRCGESVRTLRKFGQVRRDKVVINHSVLIQE
ncbi:hypothetical protein NADFUDRAFT_51473 [Nadsonia fulvescens var. elongata DSM 6958]|uniref:Pex N-terminal domain-containing protein n=1 Tax=Nadsonia fulvescens var. elongata DSM 6958 TaxID=857566 RepID=A0A1E3PIV5_9ASCO|nr:hypothetical protein NADFUDRAFT_51473 [Nadsonia fulvescens var. elongata DSM 6958]